MRVLLAQRCAQRCQGQGTVLLSATPTRAPACAAGGASAKRLRVRLGAVHVLNGHAQDDQVGDTGAAVSLVVRVRAVRSLVWPMRRLLLHAGRTRESEQTAQWSLASAAAHACSTVDPKGQGLDDGRDSQRRQPVTGATRGREVARRTGRRCM